MSDERPPVDTGERERFDALLAARRALHCLYAEAPESVARDVALKVEAAFAALLRSVSESERLEGDAMAFAVLERQRDDAVAWIRVVGEELVVAGFPAGDRETALRSVRSLLAARSAATATNSQPISTESVDGSAPADPWPMRPTEAFPEVVRELDAELFAPAGEPRRPEQIIRADRDSEWGDDVAELLRALPAPPDPAAIALANAVAHIANGMNVLENGAQTLDEHALWDALADWRTAVGIPGALWPLPEHTP